MAKNTKTEAAVETTKTRGVDLDVATKLVETMKAKSPEMAKILEGKIAAFIDARDEKRKASKELSDAFNFLKNYK